tara:strand:- start:583 stop:1392 length:810 start_codon:yes stop_codon:yes gene_type:complete
MGMTFGNGAFVRLISEGASWRTWEIGSKEKQTAEVFRLSNDPGVLRNGNTLCSGRDTAQSLYAVFYEQRLLVGDMALMMAVFRSVEPPFDINSTGLCGTFTYTVGTAPDDTAFPEKSSDTNAGSGKWRIWKENNPIDDTQTVTLSLSAETSTSRSGDPVTFIGRCKSNKTEAYVVWGDFLGNDSNDVYSKWKRVTIRVGAGEERWGVSTDRHATFAPDWAGNLLKELLNEDRLVIQTTPYGENPVTAIFDVSELRGPLKNLAKTCNWSF